MVEMRAILVKNGAGGIDSLYLGEATKPTPESGDVIVKIKAFGLNRMDIHQREGGYPLPPGASDILGVEFSGHIVELGSEVSEWKVDDEVYGLASGGAYAEYIKVAQTHIIRKPADLSWVEAASIPENWITAFQALLVVGQFKAGESALIHAGASGVGVAASQLARLYNAKAVIATASSDEKLNWLLGLPAGPTNAVNYKTQDFAEEVKKITLGKGVDVIIDPVGQSHWHKNITSLAVDGRMTVLAVLSGNIVQNADILPILYKRLHIEGSTLRSRSVEYQADLISRFKKATCHHFSSANGTGALKLYIHKVYPWTEIQAAHSCMEANTNSGKIIVEVV